MQMPLSGFTKAFGLSELKKGLFPHFLNKEENQEYVRGVPAKDYYDPKGMSKSRRKKLKRGTRRDERKVKCLIFRKSC